MTRMAGLFQDAVIGRKQKADAGAMRIELVIDKSVSEDVS